MAGIAGHKFDILLSDIPKSTDNIADHVFFSFTMGIILERKRNKRILQIAIVLLLTPMVFSRLSSDVWDERKLPVIIGLSYFTLQMIAYITDVDRGKIVSQKNYLKYVLFISFFPQIIQGPIPRYEQLQDQLIEGHKFEEKNYIKGFMLILWFFF